jgi:tripartite ATP-independent transporter DctM subunit
MEWQLVGGGILVLLVLFIAVGLPIPFALAAASLPFLWTIQDFSTSLISAELMLWRVWVDYILLAVPLFVFLGELVGRSRIGPRLYHLMHRGVPMTGSAAYGSVGACAGFGAICGSSMIGALTIGSVALPEMLRLGYGKRIASGVIAAGGTLSVLIPPSLILLFYGIVTEVSIGELFIAGVVPGLILTCFFVAVIFGWRLLRAEDIPSSDRGGTWLLRDTLIALAPVLLIAFVIIASIYFGIATPTEAAAVAVVVTMILAFTVGKLSFTGFIGALRATLRTMGFLGLLLSAALLMGFVLNYHRVPQQFTEAFVALDLSPFLVLIMVIAFYLVVGMFLEPASMIFITLPTLFPLVHAAGYDLVWFGIIFTITMEIAVLTPPVGLNLYVLQGLAPREDPVSITDVVIGCLPFIVALVCLIVLLLAFPQIALWLPQATR